MAKQFIILCCMVAIANAGFLSSPLGYTSSYINAPAITSQQQNIYRSPGNLAQISSYSKTIDTPFSSSSKSDVRVSNPGVYHSLSYPAHAEPIAYAAAAAPAPIQYSAPVHYAAPASLHYAAPAGPAVAAPGPVVSHTTFTGLGYSYHF